MTITQIDGIAGTQLRTLALFAGCDHMAFDADAGAEAVVCIANRTVTWRVVNGLERRGIPAFGPIWDS